LGAGISLHALCCIGRYQSFYLHTKMSGTAVPQSALAEPGSEGDNDLCGLCGGIVYDLDIKGIRDERNARYQDLARKHKTAKDEGKTHKIWQMKGDFFTRLSHKRANGQKVKIDEKFRVGSEALFLPNDPEASFNETANCRCIVRYVKEYSSIQSIGDKELDQYGIEATDYIVAELRNAEDKRGPTIRRNIQLGVAVDKHGDWKDANPYVLEGLDSTAGIRGGLGYIRKGTKLIVIGLPRKDSLDLIFREPYVTHIYNLIKKYHVPVVMFKRGPDNRQFLFRPPAGSPPVMWKPFK